MNANDAEGCHSEVLVQEAINCVANFDICLTACI